MYECKYPHLFTPLKIGDTLFRNRIFASPTGTQYTTSLSRPFDSTMCYYERKAMGGSASVCIGDAIVDSKMGLAIGNHIRLDDPRAKATLCKLSEMISRHGAVAAMEMSHGGSHACLAFDGGETIYGPDDIEYVKNGITYHAHAMTREIMDIISAKFADAAAFAKRCGFGMVTLHGGHGWMLHQFMSPTTNHRTDEYGGSFENNMRFPLEVIRAVREAVGPRFPIEIRISGSEVFEGGYGIDYGVKIAKALDGLVDIIHVSAGSHEDDSVFTVTHPSMFLPDGVNVKYAAEIKKHVKKSYVATVGALSDPAQMEEIIASGKADIVELARELMCDPFMPAKARAGRDEDIDKCMRCFQCYSNLMTDGHITCAINPSTGHELEHKCAMPPAAKKRVLIVGGGIGGMQAALTAAQRGHEVILCEKTGQLGGVLLCEEKVDYKRNLHGYLLRQARRVAEAGIEIRLNTEATAELARSIEPDVIIAAVGGEAVVPPIKGIGGENVTAATELFRVPEKAGKRVVVLGGGLVGIEMAIFLAQLGRCVTIMEMASDLNCGKNIVHRKAVDVELPKLGIEASLSTRALEITADGVFGEKNGEKLFFPADTVVTAMGRRALSDVCDELRFCAPEFYQIGDCTAPQTIYDATRQGYAIAMDIGMF